MNDKINVGNIQATGSDIGCDKYLEFAFFEALHCHFSLVLSNVSVHDFDVLLNLICEDQCIGIGFRLSKDNSLALTSIANQYVSKC